MAFQKLSPEELRKHKGISFPGVTTVFWCHDGQGNLLLGKRSQNARDEHGRWDPGGGGLKHGQTLVQNLTREVKEEYGADAKRVDFIGYHDVFREMPDGTPTHWLAMLFVVHIDPKQVKIGAPEDIDEIGWFSLNKLPEPLHSQVKPIFKIYGPEIRRLMNQPV